MKTRSITFLAAVLLAAGSFVLPVSSPQAMELVNHTYHWYKNELGHHHRLTSDGRSTEIDVSFHCGLFCHNHWRGIKPGHHKSRPGKAGYFGARPHWGEDIIGYAAHLLPGRVKIAYLLSTSCTGHVGKHKEEGIASQIVVASLNGKVRLYC